MALKTDQTLHAQGQVLSSAPDMLGELRTSNDIVDDGAALRSRMADDGYIFLRSYLDRDEVLDARREMLERVAAEGGLDPTADLMDGVLATTGSVHFDPSRTRGAASLQKLLFDGPMIAFFERFLEGAVRGFDFIWLRSVGPGFGTAPHGDSVFMNRGTKQLYTAWTPLGEVDRILGGLIVLENSHKLEHIKNTYGNKDVDTWCENDPDLTVYDLGNGKPWGGQISHDPVALREQLGGRWLTADYHPGDLLVFSMSTLHASLDNRSPNLLRLSTDTRYQLASEPVDERWVGDDPIAHGPDAKRGIIC
jgi:hypothetical protein